MSVRWGISTSTVSELAGAKKNGFNWFNLPLSVLMEMNNEQFVKFRDKSKKHGYGFNICTLDLPEDVVITQQGFNVYVWMEYLKKAVERMSAIKCGRLVWSNGQSRILPEEGDVMGAKEQVAQFLFLLCELADRYNISVLVESLNQDLTNFLNTIEETAGFLDLIAMDNIYISLSANKSPLESFDIERLQKYKEIIHLIRLKNEQPVEGSVNKRILINLSRTSFTHEILLPSGVEYSIFSACKSILEN